MKLKSFQVLILFGRNRTNFLVSLCSLLCWTTAEWLQTFRMLFCLTFRSSTFQILGRSLNHRNPHLKKVWIFNKSNRRLFRSSPINLISSQSGMEMKISHVGETPSSRLLGLRSPRLRLKRNLSVGSSYSHTSLSCTSLVLPWFRQQKRKTFKCKTRIKLNNRSTLKKGNLA